MQHKVLEPLFLNARQAAELLGVSERTLHAMRARGTLPAPVQLAERALRWNRQELISHVLTKAPRVVGAAEPEQLASVRLRGRAAA